MNFLEEIIKELIKNKAQTLEDLARVKRKVAKKYKIPFPDNISLLKTYHELKKNKKFYFQKKCGKQKIKIFKNIENLLITRPVRSLSGIVNISVLTKNHPCPGKCLYCPQEKDIPKSYVSGEPAVERAKKLKFNPYLQTEKRIEMLKIEGHPTDKIELRIVGATWSYYPKTYQSWFIKRCFQACNESANSKTSNLQFTSSPISEQKRRKNLSLRPAISKKTPNLKSQTLKTAQKLNEKAKNRIIGLSIETRPDFINEKEIKRLRELGVTMVELGIQSIYDDVLNKNLRGHGVKEIILATKLLRNAGFKILYQMMPNLPGSSLKKDKAMFVELFKNPCFKPDLLKIYPCALLKEAPLYELWKIKKYKPYEKLELIELIKSIKKIVPYYVRIQRISRDIPSGSIIFGPAKISNLRQILIEDMKNKKWRCKCIRCREIGKDYNLKEKINLFKKTYQAAQGQEIFLSFESAGKRNKKRKLYSLLRLRITPSKEAIIREIHTYGRLQPLKHTDKISAISPQHKGLGKKLIKEAEKITKKEFKLNRIKIIAGVGTREYFRKLGYRLKNTYMVKSI